EGKYNHQDLHHLGRDHDANDAQHVDDEVEDERDDADVDEQGDDSFDHDVFLYEMKRMRVATAAAPSSAPNPANAMARPCSVAPARSATLSRFSTASRVTLNSRRSPSRAALPSFVVHM